MRGGFGDFGQRTLAKADVGVGVLGVGRGIGGRGRGHEGRGQGGRGLLSLLLGERPLLGVETAGDGDAVPTAEAQLAKDSPPGGRRGR